MAEMHCTRVDRGSTISRTHSDPVVATIAMDALRHPDAVILSQRGA
jgi:hypothetical protein